MVLNYKKQILKYSLYFSEYTTLYCICHSCLSDGRRIHILLCIETKQENIQIMGINSLFFKFLCQAFIAPKQTKSNPSSLELTKRQRYKIVSTKGS